MTIKISKFRTMFAYNRPFANPLLTLNFLIVYYIFTIFIVYFIVILFF